MLASALTGHSPAGLTCRLGEASAHAKPSAVARSLAEEMGVTQVQPADGVLTVAAPDARTAWAVAHWAVARAAQFGATAVSVGERTWDRGSGDDGWSDGAPSTTVTITLK